MSVDSSAFNRDVRRFKQRSHQDFMRAIADATNKLQKMAKSKVRSYTRNSRTKSGNLINHINQKILNRGFTGEVTSAAAYSQAFEEGTRPHTIRIRAKKILAGPRRGAPAGWKSFSGDYAVYGKKVQHPGTEPRPFMFPAFMFAYRYFEKQMKKALS